MSKRIGFLLPVAVIVGVALLVAGCGSSSSSSSTSTSSSSTSSSGGGESESGGESETVKVGLLTSNSGECQPPDEAAQAGLEIAAEKVNASNPEVDGKKIQVEFVTEDTKSENTAGVTALTSLIRDDGIKFVIGPECGAYVEPGLAPVAEKDGILMINGIGDPELADVNSGAAQGQAKYVFSQQPGAIDSGFGASELFKLFPDYSSIHKVFVLVQNDGVGKPFGEGFTKGLEAQGMEVEAQYFDPTTTDFSGFIAKAKAYHPDVLLAGTYQQASQTILRQTVQQQAAPRYFGYGEDLNDAIKGAIGKPIPIPSVWVVFPKSLQHPTNEAVAELAKSYAAAGNDLTSSDSSYAAGLYDALPLLVEAMEEAGTTEDVASIAKALETLKSAGVVGDPITYGKTHLLEFDVDGCLVEGGKVVKCSSAPLVPGAAQE